jgi:hypothetical protein
LQPKSQNVSLQRTTPIAGGDFDSRYSQRGVQWAVKQASKAAGITKEVCVLRHTLLRIYSKTDSILSLKNLLGHENIETTMDYLHIAQLDTIKAFSPLDTLFAAEVAHVLDKLGQNIENLGLNTWQLRTLSAVRRCRTAALGGHIDRCDTCGNISISYNSCRNRHCPKCQGKTEKIGYKLDKANFTSTLFSCGFYLAR